MPTGSTPAPTERRVLRHEVLQTLRTGILAGEIVPGTRLLEIPLAAEFGVSRGPLREALRQLEQEGLVEFHTHRGAVVVGVANTEIETIYGIRSLLEERAFASAARVITDDDLDALSAIVDRMVAASEAGDSDAATEYDMSFHGRVVELSGFQYLRHLWVSIDGLVRLRDQTNAWSPKPTDPASDDVLPIEPKNEHQDLVEALRTRRPAIAGRAAKAHITSALQRLRAAERR